MKVINELFLKNTRYPKIKTLAIGNGTRITSEGVVISDIELQRFKRILKLTSPIEIFVGSEEGVKTVGKVKHIRDNYFERNIYIVLTRTETKMTNRILPEKTKIRKPIKAETNEK